MRRPKVLLTSKTKAAQKKLFAKLMSNELGWDLIGLHTYIGSSYATIWHAANLERPISYHDVVPLCILADGFVKPHELRPDVFHPDIVKLYGDN